MVQLPTRGYRAAPRAARRLGTRARTAAVMSIHADHLETPVGQTIATCRPDDWAYFTTSAVPPSPREG